MGFKKKFEGDLAKMVSNDKRILLSSLVILHQAAMTKCLKF